MPQKCTPSRQQFVRLCECGCAQPTLIAIQRGASKAIVGQPLRRLHGHSGYRNTHAGRTRKLGYWFRYRPEHPAANSRGYVLEHRLVMEVVLGRFLTPDEAVHHRDCDKGNNTHENLQVMSWEAHARLHREMEYGLCWTRHYDACRECGTSDIPHQGKGLCERCYSRHHWRLNFSHLPSLLVG